MNNDVRTLLNYVVDNDLVKARQAAKIILSTNSVQKDKDFCDKLLNKMDVQDANGIEIPYNLKTIIRTSASTYGFDKGRYFLTKREAEVFDHIKRMYEVGAEMAAMNLHYPNAVMLSGLSGTGKTTFAQYVAKELDLPFLYVSITQLMDSLLGKTGQNMENVFQFASSVPCVLVLDEIDQVATRRSDDGSGVNGEIKRVLITIMQNIDLLPNNVILIAATNRPDVIDPAVMRRFPLRHTVEPLKSAEAEEFIDTYLTQLGLEWSGSTEAFLALYVQKRQDQIVERGRYLPAAITDVLNEKIAESILMKGENEDPVVYLCDTDRSRNKIKGDAKSLSDLKLDAIECPRCKKKNLEAFRSESGIVPEYKVGCWECDWVCDASASTDIGDSIVLFKDWYGAWKAIGSPENKLWDPLIKERGVEEESSEF